jgi:hypothetical protein
VLVVAIATTGVVLVSFALAARSSARRPDPIIRIG